ncbi:patatin-like phospholipase family protein [Pelagovum pacificum]|uniref:Patatin-like phospholipase family protein n=1 Tax=Pelagovum pacificum TaxID=2588711 RepID=A0A5C5GA25_9RHOB|nr:patatin-like phospholipase family protein [Pelagovum pacificum]QQA42554.1 patatin-like phospholipase family protein [Pelagovum pacificum]TNY31638.1 patatin-like phospholipase family protein [Pelagovum pacificum]
MAGTLPRFDQLVFSGGGLRCFWQGGFLDEVRDVIGLEPDRLAGVSGGAMTLVGFMSRRGPQVLDVMCDRFADRDTNIAWDSMGEDGLTPHQRMYREAMAQVIDDHVLRDVAEGRPAQILIGHPPVHKAPKWSGSAAAVAYEAELHSVGSPHFSWAEKFGVTTTFVNANQAARDGTLLDLVCAAATIPPVFEPPLWNGKPVIDGGMSDQAPMPDPHEGETLVMLTRVYDGLEPVEGRFYIQPGAETPADKIDFTDPQKLRDTWDAGVEDGRRFLKENGY